MTLISKEQNKRKFKKSRICTDILRLALRLRPQKIKIWLHVKKYSLVNILNGLYQIFSLFFSLLSHPQPWIYVLLSNHKKSIGSRDWQVNLNT